MAENTEKKKRKTRKIEVPFEAASQKPYVFASYAHDDKDVVFPMLKELYELGWDVWYDEGITIGAENYHTEIRERIVDSEVFVLFTTTWSLSRKYIVDREIQAARDSGKIILPLYIRAEGESEVYTPKEVAKLLPAARFDSVSEIDRELRKLKIANHGKREAVGVEREVAEEWFDGHDLARAGAGGNLVGCEERPYVCLAFNREDVVACNPYAKELFYAGFNVRSCENSPAEKQKAMLTGKDCRAYIPFVTKKYIESGLLERDYAWAKEAGVLIFPLLMNDCEEEDKPVIPPHLKSSFGLIHGLAACEFRPIDFLSKLETRIEELGCCVRNAAGEVERRSFSISDFLYELTEDGKGIVLTKYVGDARVVKPERVYHGFRVRGLAEGTFARCDHVTEVVLPPRITKLSNSLFSCCSSLKGVEIPEGVNEIGSRAFFQCMELEKIRIPDSVTKIGGGAFFNCFCLKTLKIPNSVQEIGPNLVKKFSGCTVSCARGSYAEKYCRKNHVKYTTPFRKVFRTSFLVLLAAAVLVGLVVQMTGVFDILGWLAE